MSKTYQIGDLATRVSVQVETIRYYEKEGLLPEPSRSDGNYRLYSDSHLKQLEFILHCRALDLSQDEIRELMRLRDTPDAGCAEVDALLDEHIEHVSERIRLLTNLKTELKHIRTQCNATGSARDCGVIQTLQQPVKQRKGAPAHSPGVHAPKRSRK